MKNMASVKREATHSEEALIAMNSMRLKGELCDVELLAAGRRIPAHRLVLASCSPYFHSMFTSKMKESCQKEIAISEVDPHILERLVDFCYTSLIEFSEENVESLLAASNLLQLTRVRDSCAEFLKNLLHPSNCLGFRSFADAYTCTDLLEFSHRFALQHFDEVSKAEEFLLLPLSDMLKLLSCDEIYNVQSEEVVYNAALGWVKYNPGNRKQSLGEILLHIRLPGQLTKEFVMVHAENNELVKVDPGSGDLLIDGMKDDILSEEKPHKKPILFAIGGDNQNDCECYDPATDLWSMIAPMSTKRRDAGVAALYNKIYAIGGYMSGWSPPSSEPLATVEAYSPETNSWSVLPSMGTPRSSLAVAVLDGLIYAIGGFDGMSILSSVERYDPLSMRWTPIASMNSRRTKLRGAAMAGLIYAVGGCRGNNMSLVECYDPKTNEWSRVPNMNTPRSNAGVAVIDNKLYVVGGEGDDSGGSLDTMECYDPIFRNWTELAPMKSYRNGHGVAVVSGILYVVGGDGVMYFEDLPLEREMPLDSIEKYDPQKDTWSTVRSMNSTREGTGAVVADV